MTNSQKLLQQAAFVQRNSKQFLKYFCAFLVYIFFSEIFLVNYGFVDVCHELAVSHQSLVAELNRIQKQVESGYKERALGIFDFKLEKQNSKLFLLSSKFRQTELAYSGLCESKASQQFEKIKFPFLKIFHFSQYSTVATDSALLYIFSIIGTKNRVAVELEGGHFQSAYHASAHFLLYPLWSQIVVIYSSFSGYTEGAKFYQTLEQTYKREKKHDLHQQYPTVTLIYKHLDIENVEQALSNARVIGEIDYLCSLVLFILFIFIRISTVKPRVLVVTYQEYFGPDIVAVRSYQPNDEQDGSRFYHCGKKEQGRNNLFTGASLAAVIRASRKKGYRLVGCLQKDPIALFIRNGEGERFLPEATADSCFRDKLQDNVWLRDQQILWEESHSYSWVYDV
ncbi:uncharacterized protein Gasu_65500 [Galdieria sulphuraria]|uniref:Uncharacterized protein n=1 Tax=Galdieria sulphuraria TaxID=130081 RepID=M2WPT8_GALSU|nr:uncharacterized protein Gasu_65500 [Galdieria sulphuraria]EME25790.1 hypothetical protein Gasu_65500 [Galdieria sulphuraria]|eukprot:XP_005702310.1 hypothetical protein Gasu_65500 [Galdieria sulphuraria]